MLKVEKNIFKEYDIRGIYPQDFNEKVAYRLGQVFAYYTQVKKVLIGRDMRLSSPKIFTGLTQGLMSQGIKIDDVGLVSIDVVYSMTAKLSYDAGLMITASHNPKEYNGLKMVKRDKIGLEMIGGKKILEWLEKERKIPTKGKGGIKKRNLLPEYLKHIFSFVNLKKIKPLKVVVDAGNGMAGKMIPLIAKSLPCKIIPLYFKLDGSFPCRPPNPLQPGATDEAIKKVIKEKADFGVVFDGDADRLFLIDEKGQLIRGDLGLLLLAKKVLAEHPGTGIVYTINLSRAVPELVKKMGGRPIRSRIGYRFVSQNMKNYQGMIGGEMSAHYSFRDNYYTDSGFIAFLFFLEIISESRKKLSALVKDFNPYYRSDEINFETSKSKIQKIINQLEKKYADGKIDKLDGLTVEYQDWWFNARPSNTEPLLRLTVEAKTKKLLEEKKKEVINLIK